jgi:hypothetical protein
MLPAAQHDAPATRGVMLPPLPRRWRRAVMLRKRYAPDAVPLPILIFLHFPSSIAADTAAQRHYFDAAIFARH